MKCGAALAVILAMLALPALAQRGSARGGAFGSRGFGGHAAHSARPGFPAHRGFPGNGNRPEPGGYAPAAPFRYDTLGPPPAVRFDPPRISNPRIGASQNGIITSGSPFRGEFRGGGRIWNGNPDRGGEHHRGRHGSHNHDRFRGRARSFENWYLFSYPGWVGYPYAMDPSFYEGSYDDGSGYDQNDEGPAYNNENPDDQPDYSNREDILGGAYGEADEQPQPWPEPPASEPGPDSHFSVAGLGAASESAPGGPLRVIFKGGRAPETMQNYMLTAKSLTDLDADHYEQIPLEEIDLAATTLANRASGLEFRVPGASRD